jgi:hypothetical protein
MLSMEISVKWNDNGFSVWRAGQEEHVAYSFNPDRWKACPGTWITIFNAAEIVGESVDTLYGMTLIAHKVVGMVEKVRCKENCIDKEVRRAVSSMESKVLARDIVYVIESGGLFKIGKSKNPNKRINNLRNSSASPVSLYKLIPHSVEEVLHRILDKDRLHGEWFKPSEFVKKVLDNI